MAFVIGCILRPPALTTLLYCFSTFIDFSPSSAGHSIFHGKQFHIHNIFHLLQFFLFYIHPNRIFWNGILTKLANEFFFNKVKTTSKNCSITD